MRSLDIDLTHNLTQEDPYDIVEKYLYNSFDKFGVDTPDYIYGKVIYLLLDKQGNPLDAFRIVTRVRSDFSMIFLIFCQFFVNFFGVILCDFFNF